MTLNKRIKKSIVLQNSESNCGPACLSSIYKYYGILINQETIQKYSGTTDTGTSLLGLYQASKQLGFFTEGFEAEITHLKDLTAPCVLPVIINQQYEHYIVLYRYDGKNFIIGNPATGIEKLSEKELEKIWASKALLTIKPTENSKSQPYTKRNKINWFFETLKADIPYFIISIMIGVVISFLTLAVTFFSQKLIDNFLPNEKYEQIIWGFVFLLFIFIVTYSLTYFKNILILTQGKEFKKRLLSKLMFQILRLSKTYFNSTKSGDIINRINDSERIQSVIVDVINIIIIEVISIVITSIYLSYYSWQISLIMFLYVPILALISIAFSTKINNGQKQVMISHSWLESRFINVVTNIDTIKAFNLQNDTFNQTNAEYKNVQDNVYQLGKINAKYTLFINLLTGFILICVFSFSVYNVVNNVFKIGVLVAVISIFGNIVASAIKISSFLIRYNEAVVAFDRIYDFYLNETEDISNKIDYTLENKQSN